MKAIHTIAIHPLAPEKPKFGQPCNGCGICCLAEPCPLAHVYLWQFRGSCRALVWQAEQQRYACGMLLYPERFVRLLPARLAPYLKPWFARRIAAGVGCDSSDELLLHE